MLPRLRIRCLCADPTDLVFPQVASKLDPADKETIEKAVDETVEWLDSNQLAEVCA